MADSKADSSYSEEQDTLEDSEVEDAMEEWDDGSTSPPKWSMCNTLQDRDLKALESEGSPPVGPLGP
jgi:hypothetical protein